MKKLSLPRNLFRAHFFKSTCIAVFGLLICPWTQASPWMESDDAYLRSDLQVLADAGLIATPINTYPIRWSRIDAELQKVDAGVLTLSLRQAYAHVTYALEGGLMGRGSRRFKFSFAKSTRSDLSFAAPVTGKWQGQGSYEVTSSSYAFRLAAGVQRTFDKHGSEENDYSLDDSYIAGNLGNLSLSFGALQRWWGPTWIYNLGWGHTARPVPGVDLAYDAYDWPLIGSLHVESFIGNDKTPNHNRKQWSSRLEVSPTSWLNIGVGYHKWFDKEGIDGYPRGIFGSEDDKQEQYHADIRLSLPTATFYDDYTLTESIYGQAATLIDDHSLGAYVAGWQGQVNIADQYFRLIVEAKQLSSDAKEQWRRGLANRKQMAGLNYGNTINNSELGESQTVKLLWVTPGDWEWTVQGQRYDDRVENSHNRGMASLSIPLANSRLTLGSDYDPDAAGGNDEWNYWGSWDFRF